MDEVSKTYCLAPWTSLYVQHDGDVFPCCHWTRFQSLGNLKTQTMGEIWNSPRTKELRKTLLQNESPKECEDCRFFDKIGAQSLRKDYFRDQKDFLPRIHETKPDGHFESQDIVSLSIAVGTKCQLRCRTCGPSDSSAWESHVNQGSIKSKTLEHLEEIEKVLQSSKSINRVLFVGGEPIIHDNHYEVLSLLMLLQEKPRLYYNTNLFQLAYKQHKITDCWNQFPDVTAYISIDGVGDRFDFLRTGHKWSKLLENLKTLRSESPHVQVKAYVTISLYNFYYMPETIQGLIDEAGFGLDQIHFNIVRIPLNMNIRHAPEKLKSQARIRYTAFMKQLLMRYDHLEASRIISGLQGIMSFFDGEPSRPEHFQEFLEYNRTEKIPERLPGFTSTFSELENF